MLMSRAPRSLAPESLMPVRLSGRNGRRLKITLPSRK